MKIDRPSYESLSKTPSLLILNDVCLWEIFQWLDLDDFMNLASTKLRGVGNNSKRFKEINVHAGKRRERTISNEEFSNVLTVICDHVLAVQFSYTNQVHC